MLAGALYGLAPLHAAQSAGAGDPLNSPQWPTLQQEYLGGAPVRFTDAVRLRTPAFAEDPLNVPVQVDARALADETDSPIRRIVVLADRNPIRQVLGFEPLRALPVLAFRMRLEQASPVRALVQTHDGQWHGGGAMIQAAGGGCTVPGASRADGSWKDTLGQVQARVFPNLIEGSRRLRLRVMHPMDTGLVDGIPAFYLEQLELVDSGDQPWWRLTLHEPVSENPLLTLELPSEVPPAFRLRGQDNNGNRVDAEVRT